jgi:heat shock protein HslJ
VKGVIGFLFFMLFLAGYAFVSLQSRQLATTTQDASDDPITVGAWRGLRLYGRTVPAEIDVHLSFGADGRLQGSAGCNRVSGRYERSDDRLRVASLRATRRQCSDEIMTVERSVFDVLRDARRCRLAGDELRLLDADGEWLATFQATAGEASGMPAGS